MSVCVRPITQDYGKYYSVVGIKGILEDTLYFRATFREVTENFFFLCLVMLFCRFGISVCC